MIDSNVFKKNVERSPHYTNLLKWMKNFVQDEEAEWKIVRRRRPNSFFLNLMDCYLEDAAECYLQLRINHYSVCFMDNGIKLNSKSFYEYMPLTPLVFLGTLYAMYRFDTHKWGRDFYFESIIYQKMEEINPMATREFLDLFSQKTLAEEIKKETIGRNCVNDNKIRIEKIVEKQLKIKLSTCFVNELRESKQACALFKDILETTNPNINKKNGERSGKWQWPHLFYALLSMKLIDELTNPTDFGRAIHDIIPERSAKSISQSFKTGRINDDFPTITDDNIIADIAKQFQPVLDAIKP